MHLIAQNDQLVVQTPCKINPFLEVLARRSDGYHDLDTVMIACDLCDELIFTPCSGKDLLLEVFADSTWIGSRKSYKGLDLDGPTEKNIVWRAVQRLSEELAFQSGLRIVLKKRIPIQAGLGGGSSDAAATLVATQLLWTGKYDAQLAAKIAAELGSDINFFLEGYCDGGWSARCTERGQDVKPFDSHASNAWILLFPNGGCSTKEVFEELNLEVGKQPNAKSAEAVIAALNANNFAEIQSAIFNRLFASAKRRCEEVDQLSKKLLMQNDLGPHIMSGSGSTIVIPCETKECSGVLQRLKSRFEIPVYAANAWSSKSIQQQVFEINIQR